MRVVVAVGFVDCSIRAYSGFFRDPVADGVQGVGGGADRSVSLGECKLC
jgi:hypothetical protein